MREIKFRAWNRQGEFWVDSNEVCIFGDGDIGVLDIDTGELDFGGPIDIVFYTGLKDKQGKEIYEGDIIELLPNTFNDIYQENKGVRAEVKYFESGFWYFTNMDTKGMLYEYCRWILNDSDENKVEVIGNIYEDKDLLDTKNQK